MARKGDTNIDLPHGAGPLDGDTTGEDTYTDHEWDPRDVGQNSLPRLYGPGLGNPYGTSDFEGTSNANDTRKHELNRERVRGAVRVKGTDSDDPDTLGPQPTKTK